MTARARPSPVAAEVRGPPDAQLFAPVKRFGGPRLLLETIREEGESAIAGATTRSDRQPCLPASTIPLQIATAEFTNPTGTATAVPKETGGIVEATRQLSVARAGALRARTAAPQQLDDLIVTAPEQLRRAAPRPHLACDEPAQAAKLALRSLARRARDLEREIVELDRQLEQPVNAAAPRTTNLFGVATQSASQLLVNAGQNIDRLRNEAASARICGAAPIQASSGRANRHRLDFGGDRQANRALHMIAVCRLRHCDRTRATPPNAPPTASTDARSSAASNATSPARPTTLFAPTFRHSTVLDIYRNVPSSKKRERGFRPSLCVVVSCASACSALSQAASPAKSREG
jgi:hypothetical protein